MFLQVEFELTSRDWGEANFNPMVRAWGLKTNRKAKCKSCVFYSAGQCKFRCPYEHEAEYQACSRYESKNKRRPITWQD